jgi:hypothetical protein
MTVVKRALTELADVIRSKNAGPYELTLDIIFKTREIYDQVVASKTITPEKIAALYSLPPEKVISFVEFAPARAIKITLERPIVCGDVGDNDIYGAQQHAPLLLLELPLPERSAESSGKQNASNDV